MSEIRSTHPMFIVAAAAVTAFSLTGVAVLGGWLPRHNTETSPLPVAASAPAATTTQQLRAAATLNVPAGTTVTVEPKHHATTRPAIRSTAVTHEPAAEKSASATVTAMPATGTTRVSSPAPTNDNGIYVESARPSNAPSAPVAQSQAVCNECGTVESVRETSQPSEGSWIGSVAGGVIGGLLGNQVGRGNGKTLATVAGAVGGAFAGREVEKHVRTDKQYQVTVRFDDGNVRAYTETSEPILKNGDRVRASGNRLDPM